MNDFNEIPLYPFRFDPIYKQFFWGGTRFSNLLHRPVAEHEKFAESWDLVDLAEGGSVITNGPYFGKAFHELVSSRSDEFFGLETHKLDRLGRFPIMLKYIDAQELTDVYVHPSEQYAEEMNFPDTGKTEVLLILDAEPDAVLYAGFNQPYSRPEVEAALQEGRFESLLQKFQPKAGDCFLLKPGVVHAVGNGLLAVLVQTTSHLTYPVYHWNRDCEPQIRIEEVLPMILYNEPSTQPLEPLPTENRTCKQLARCNEFIVNRWTFDELMIWAPDHCCHIWSVLQGEVTAVFHIGRRGAPENISGRQSDPIAIEKLQQGDTLLVPPSCRSIQWTSDCDEPIVLLDIVGI